MIPRRLLPTPGLHLLGSTSTCKSFCAFVASVFFLAAPSFVVDVVDDVDVLVATDVVDVADAVVVVVATDDVAGVVDVVVDADVDFDAGVVAFPAFADVALVVVLDYAADINALG